MMHSHHHAFEFGSYLVSLILSLTALIYLRGLSHTRSHDQNGVGLWRTSSFLVGLFLIWAAMVSPLAVLDHRSLTAHMAQHLLLMTFAPALIWLGAPIGPLLDGLPERWTRLPIRPICALWMHSPARALTHPVVCWLGATATLIVWHIPAAFMLALRSPGWHEVEETSFLATGLLFWWPVIRPWPSTARVPSWGILLYLFLATLPCDILSGFLVFCERVVYPVYFSPLQTLRLSALEDQECAGALMWTCVTIVYLIAGTIFAVRLLSPENRGWTLPSGSHSSMARPGMEVV